MEFDGESQVKALSVLLLTQNYPPSTAAGASIHYDILVRSLKKIEGFKRIVVLTEFVKGRPLFSSRNILRINRVLLPKAKKGRSERWGLGMRASVFILNNILLMVFVPILSLLNQIDIIHIHCSFFKIAKSRRLYNRLVHFLLLGLRKFLDVKVVVDVDNLGNIFKRYNKFDKIICGSKNVYNAAIDNGLTREECAYTPFPFEKPVVPNICGAGRQWLKQFQPYVCFVGLITEMKGVYELIDAFQMLSRDLAGYNLVFVGGNLEGTRFLDKLKETKNIHYLGIKPYAETMEIISEAELLVLPSKSEALGRVCLEAISLGTKVLLPPGIPEYYEHCRKFQLNLVEPSEIRLKMYNLLRNSDKACYPFEKHEPLKIAQSVVSVYHEML